MTAPPARTAPSEPATRTLRTFSYGGGVQSTAALVLAAEGKIDYPTLQGDPTCVI